MRNSKHIIFDKEYKELISSYSSSNETYNWGTEGVGPFYQFGGKLNSDINILLNFEKVPKYLNWMQVEKLMLAINFETFFNSILDDKILSYRHSNDGTIELISKGIQITVPYRNFPIKRTRIQIVDTPIEYINQSWEGNTNKLNHGPIWVQNHQVPKCPICDSKMDFLIQLSSGLPEENYEKGYELMFGNDGELYGFWCIKDKVSSYIWQCT